MSAVARLGKYFQLLLNVLVTFCGAVLTFLGAILIVNENKKGESVSLGAPFTASGIIIFTLGFFASFGSLKDNWKDVAGICAYASASALLWSHFR